MNKSFLLVAVIVSLAACKSKPEDVIAKTKKKVAETEKKLPDLKQRTVDDITSAARGNITGYYKNDEVKKIYSEHFSDTNRVFISDYFDDGLLIYIEEDNFRYNCSDKITEQVAAENKDTVWYDDKRTKLLVSRYYFNDNKLIKWDTPPNTAMDRSLTDKQSLLWAQTAVMLKELKDE